MINTKFWSDPWVMKNLNPLDRYLFLYLLTNERTNISGIYELSSFTIAFDTGIERDTILKTMIDRLAPKIYLVDEWVIIVNFPSHQALTNPKIKTGVQIELQKVPDKIYEAAIGYGYPIHRQSHPNPNPNPNSNPNSNPNNTRLKNGDSEQLIESEIDDDGFPVKSKVKKVRSPEATEVSAYFFRKAGEYTRKPLVNTGYAHCLKFVGKASVGDLKGIIDDYFERQPSEEVATNIYRCLSASAVNKYLATN